MAIPTNVTETFDRVGIKQDIADVIYNISPVETPFISNASKSTAIQTLHEWQTDALEAAAANAQVEGYTYGLDTRAPTVKLQNYTQITAKAVGVTGTDQAVSNWGRGQELAYQMAKVGKELKRDIEFANINTSNAKVGGSSGTARESGSIDTYYGGNVPGTGSAALNYYKNGGTVPTGNGSTAEAGGTDVAFTEDLLKDGLKKCYELGGDPDVVLMNSTHKQTASGFNGIATNTKNIDDKRVIGAVDVYVSDFSTVTFVPDRYQNANRVDILDMSKWAIAYLRPFQTKDLSDTSDATQKLMLCEWTVEARNPNASYGIFNLA
jgi:hypothetical protein